MRVALREHLALTRQLDSLTFDLLRRRLDQPRQPAAMIQAHLSLLTRVLQDLRASALLAVSGYTMQAWAISASAFEAAHAMGFIAVDPQRAELWLVHEDPNRQFCSAKTGVQGSFKYLEIGRQGKKREALVEHEYSLYERLCMAKHVHPIAERTRYIGHRDGATRLSITPYYSERRVREARLGLLLASRAATLAVWIFHKAHFGTTDADNARLTALAKKTNSLLDTWKGVEE